MCTYTYVSLLCTYSVYSALVDTEDEIPDFVEFASSDKNTENESVIEVKERPRCCGVVQPGHNPSLWGHGSLCEEGTVKLRLEAWGPSPWSPFWSHLFFTLLIEVTVALYFCLSYNMYKFLSYHINMWVSLAPTELPWRGCYSSSYGHSFLYNTVDIGHQLVFSELNHIVLWGG